MRVIKPLTQSLLHRKFDYDKKSFISIVGSVFFDFKTQTLCSEQDLWKHFGEECLQQFDVEILDLIGKKKTPEVVVNAYAYGKYAEGGKTIVQLKLNNVSKTLEVWGNRYWIDGKPSTPEDFDKIPINWRNTYGGADFDQNPKGKGRDYIEIGEDQLRVKPLPNIEHPSYPIHNERDEPPPVTLTTLPVEYPDRNKLMGSYDDQWRQEEFPDLAKDVDWSYFNQSPEDQRLGQLKVGDQATFIHMHPEKATCTMTIPPIVLKAFVRLVKEKDKQTDFLHSVDLSLTTLWAFPHLEKAFLIYEGILEIPRWFFVDDIVAELMGAIEHTERAKPLSYYEEIFRLRTDDKTSMHYASLDKQLVDEVFLPPSQRIPVGIALKYKLKRLIKELRPLEQSYADNQNRIAEFQKEGYDIENFDVKSFLQENFGEEVQNLDDLEKWLDNGIDLEKENQKLLEEELQEKSVLTQVREARKEIKQAEKKREEANKSISSYSSTWHTNQRGSAQQNNYRKKDTYEIVNILISFRNLQQTQVETTLAFTDTKPSLKRFEQGRLLNLRLNHQSNFPPFLVEESSVSKRPLIFGLLFFLCTLCYALGIFALFSYIFTDTFSIQFLEIMHPWVLTQILALLLFVVLQYSLKIASYKNSNEKLILQGKKTKATIIEYHQTGLLLNEQPQIDFHLIFTDDKLQKFDIHHKKLFC